MEIIIKLDHDELNKVKTYETKDRERDQLIHIIKHRDDELQDLKLENDRLKRRDSLMYNFIKSTAVSRYEWVSVQADEILRRLEEFK